MKMAFVVFFMSLVSIHAFAQNQCAAYCLDVRTLSNPKTQQPENHFNRSPYIRASNFPSLVSKCKSNFGTALVLTYNYKKSRSSSSILTSYKSAQAATACKSI